MQKRNGSAFTTSNVMRKRINAQKRELEMLKRQNKTMLSKMKTLESKLKSGNQSMSKLNKLRKIQLAKKLRFGNKH